VSINSKTKAVVDGLLTDADTTESSFKTGLKDVTSELESLNSFSAGPFASTLADETDLSIDLSAGNNFTLTPTSSGSITFTTIVEGQSGNIYLDNSAGVAISKGSGVKAADADMTLMSNTGFYWLSYFAYDSSNVLLVSSQALTGA